MKFNLFQLLFSIIFIIGCKRQNSNHIKLPQNIDSHITENKKLNDELYKGKIFYAGDELNDYTFIYSSEVIANDSITYSIYQRNGTNQFVFSLEKFLSNDDKEKFQIIDILNFENYDTNKNKIKTEENNREYIISFLDNGKTLQTWDFSKNEKQIISPYNKYLYILLYDYLRNGINSKDVLSEKTKLTIESIIGNYSYQEDFFQPSFFERESKIIDNTISKSNLEIWETCNDVLDFSKIVPENELESDWSYPYKRIKSLNAVYTFYKNASYGDSFEGKTISQHMALYMYFLSWKERKYIYEEIDKLKGELLEQSKN